MQKLSRVTRSRRFTRKDPFSPNLWGFEKEKKFKKLRKERVSEKRKALP
jgi:hypothetical protein